MSDVEHKEFCICLEDVRRYGWQELIAGTELKDCRDYWEVLQSEANRLESTGDDVGKSVFSLLAMVASFRAVYETNGCVYCEMYSFVNGMRSGNLDDLTNSDLAALAGVMEEIDNPVYRARVADVLWATRKDAKAARIAVAAFVDAAKRLKDDASILDCIEYLKRAAQICANKGFEAERATVLSAIESSIGECVDKETPDAICHHFMQILLAVRQGDPAKYAALSERIATDCAGENDWHLCEMYWQLAVQWHHRAKNSGEVQRCQLAAAECNVSRGDAMLTEHGSLSAAHWYGRGVEALRRAKADPERIKAVHRRFLELEKQGVSKMKPFEPGFENDPDFRTAEENTQKESAAFVRGVDFQTAISRFVVIREPTHVEGLKKTHTDISKGLIADKLFGSSIIDHTGKVADWVPPKSFDSGADDPESQRKRLYNLARMTNWPIRVIWVLEPARLAILDEHPVRQQDLFFLVFNNPFIPQGHEGVYLRGLHSGFLGDWLVAMHLLVPQIEASIRHVLQQRGVVTSTLVEGIQQERDLNQLLWIPEVEAIFGADMMFDLRGILIERFGHNLRNQLAHGLLPEGGFYREASSYLWWLILRLCWAGFRLAHLPDEETAKA